MCRLLGVVSRSVEAHPAHLTEHPKSLAALSPDHPHGWGIAVHDGRAWSIHKSPTCAKGDARFHELARDARGRVLVAHVRKATVGRTGLQNTHPFRRDAWVFAHNGTISDVDWLERRTSGARLRECEGDTDSERFFAYLMTILDDVGASRGQCRAAAGSVNSALAQAVAGATSRARFGAANFLLSDGDVLYAHRFGRTLFVSTHEGAIRVASEAGHEGAWTEVSEGTLLRIDNGAEPTMTQISGQPSRASRLPRRTLAGDAPDSRRFL